MKDVRDVAFLLTHKYSAMFYHTGGELKKASCISAKFLFYRDRTIGS